MSTRIRGGLLAAALCAVLSANATTVYTFQLDGTRTFSNSRSTSNWFGSMTVEVADTSNGVFTGSSLLGIDLRTNLGNFHADGSRPTWAINGRAPTATVVDGALADVQAGFFFQSMYFDPCQELFVRGMSVEYLSYTGLGPSYNARAELNVPVAAVPEPETWLLMLAGLIPLIRRRKR